MCNRLNKCIIAGGSLQNIGHTLNGIFFKDGCSSYAIIACQRRHCMHVSPEYSYNLQTHTDEPKLLYFSSSNLHEPDWAVRRLLPVCLQPSQVAPCPLNKLSKLLYSAMCHGRRSSSLSHFALFPTTLHFHSLQPLIISAAFPVCPCAMHCFWFQLQSILLILVLFSLRQGHHVLLRTALLCNYSWLSATQEQK